MIRLMSPRAASRRASVRSGSISAAFIPRRAATSGLPGAGRSSARIARYGVIDSRSSRFQRPIEAAAASRRPGRCASTAASHASSLAIGGPSIAAPSSDSTTSAAHSRIAKARFTASGAPLHQLRLNGLQLLQQIVEALARFLTDFLIRASLGADDL